MKMVFIFFYFKKVKENIIMKSQKGYIDQEYK